MKLVKDFIKRRSSKPNQTLLTHKRPFHPIKESCELDEEDVNFSQKPSQRAKRI